MKSKYLLLPLLLLFFLLISSCGKNHKETVIYDSGVSYDLHTIEIFDNTIYTTGGDVWNKSEIATSVNGTNWDLDSLADKSIFDLYSDGEDIFGVGGDGYILQGKDFELRRTSNWGILQSFVKSDNGYVAAGGKDWNKGWIYTMGEDFEIDTTFIFEHEFKSIARAENGALIAVGYGVIYNSMDNGYHWEKNEREGDFFTSLVFDDDGNGFIVGLGGSILKSEDNGDTWDSIKDGHSTFSNGNFRAIKFRRDMGAIVGDDGLLMLSDDGGVSWKEIGLGTNIDFFDFVFYDDELLIAGEQGKIIQVDL